MSDELRKAADALAIEVARVWGDWERRVTRSPLETGGADGWREEHPLQKALVAYHKARKASS